MAREFGSNQTRIRQSSCSIPKALSYFGSFGRYNDGVGQYTRMTRAWLQERYRRTSDDGVYCAHQPIYGLGNPWTEPNHLPRMARTYRILRVLNRLRFESLLDVGGAEGTLCRLVRDLFGADVTSGDLSPEAGLRAWDLFEVPAVAFDSMRLPFAGGAFDLVLCSEVIEHVEWPVESLLELERVARSAVLVTSEEVESDPGIHAEHHRERVDLPHAERNLFHPGDFELIFGDEIELAAEFVGEAPAEPVERGEAEAWIRAATDFEGSGAGGLGAVILHRKLQGLECAPKRSDEEILRAVMGPMSEPVGMVRRERGSGNGLNLSRLRCPLSGSALQRVDGRLTSADGVHSYAIEAEVPSLFDERALDPTRAELHEQLERRWPGQGKRIRQTLELRRRFELVDASSQSDWDFGEQAQRELWRTNDQLEPMDGDAFHWLAKGDDPWLVSPMLLLPEGGVDRMQIRMRVHNPDYPVDAGQGQLRWLGEGDLSFDEANCLTFAVRNEAKMCDYTLELSEHPNWPKGGGAVWLRLDPVNGPAEIELSGLRLLARG